MALSDKVIWSEGMFLHPAHFQQQDGYFEGLLQQRASMVDPYSWGITELQIDEQLLLLGKFSLKACSGIFPDGTSFSIPTYDKAPLCIDIPAGVENCMVYLALPFKRPGMPEAGFMGANDKHHYRYQIEMIEVADNNSVQDGRVTPVQVGRISLQLLLESADRKGFSCMGLARISEARSDQKIILDTQYMPACLNIHALPDFSSLLQELQGLLHYRGDMLLQRLTDRGAGGVAEVADFMLLQIMNRYEPLLNHFSTLKSVHPEQLYQSLIQLVGEMATFAGWQRRPVPLPAYRHDDLQTIFLMVMTELRRMLSLVLEENAVALKIEEQEPNTWVSVLADKTLLDKAHFILAVYASIPQEVLRAQFPAQIKVAPAEEIRHLVNRALPGIELNPLAVAPRQIPYHSNFVYFSLDHRHELWEKLKKSAGLAFHVGGEFPGLRFELWAVKDKRYE